MHTMLHMRAGRSTYQEQRLSHMILSSDFEGTQTSLSIQDIVVNCLSFSLLLLDALLPVAEFLTLDLSVAF